MSELDKTIEELEAEVTAELEEGAHDAPKKGAVPSNQAKKSMVKLMILERAFTKSDDKKKDYAKGVKKDGSIPSAVKGDQGSQKLKEEDGFTDDEIRELCHSKDHDCATVVEHPVWGKGKPIVNSHAIPDENGHVAWYDVQFKHGIEEKVMAKDMTILDEVVIKKNQNRK